MVLTREDAVLLALCRPYLRRDDDLSLRALVSRGIDWNLILWRAEEHRLLPLVRHHLSRLGLLDTMPAENKAYLETWYTLVELRAREQFLALGRILTAFEKAGIESFLLKGSALSIVDYPDPLVRPMQDLDLMIRPSQAWRAERVLFRLGYRHGYWDSDTARFTALHRPLTRRWLATHHELLSFTRLFRTKSPLPTEAVPAIWRRHQMKCAIDKRQIATIPVFVDVHVNLSNGIDLSDVWRGVRYEKALGRMVRVQSATSAVWFLSARLYHETFEYGTPKLAMFGDIDAVLTARGDQVDWAELLAVAYKYGMRPALYYVLGRLRQLTRSERIPETVIDLLKPSSHQAPLPHDWGDVLPKLLGQTILDEIQVA